jgi:sortase A
MRLIIDKKPLRRVLKWARRALFAGGVLLVGYCAFVVVDAWNFQRRQSAHLERLLAGSHGASAGTSQPAFSGSSQGAAAAMDGLVGRIEIPRLLFSAAVVEGIDRTTLRRAVGHIPGTPLPGQAGNVGLAGHRDTFFRPLKDLRIKDEIQFSTLKGNFTYQVESLSVVEPDNVAVLASSGESVLTLVTCYPFYYVGPAPKRWIVRARQVSAQTVASTVE